jgi:serine phosphatase RsbU (regulator of sigma subunit)
MRDIAEIWKEKIRPAIRDIRLNQLQPGRLVFFLGGWLISFYLFYIAVQTDTNWKSVWLLFNGYFWFRSNRYILKRLRLRTEYLLALILLVYIPAYIYLNYRLQHAEKMGLDPVSDIFQAILIFLLGLLLIINHPMNRDVMQSHSSDGFQFRQRTLLLFFFLGLLAGILLSPDEVFYLYLLELIILLTLLNKTTWIESLSHRQLWIWFFLFLFIFNLFGDPAGFKRLNDINYSQITTWYVIPYYVHLIIKLYFLALLIRIPVVLVYNHASIARKLRISSLFQSSFPQIIQFVFLIIIFFFFVAGWQAENIKKSILNVVEASIAGNPDHTAPYFQISGVRAGEKVVVPGYLPFEQNPDFQEYGIIRLTRENSGRNYELGTRDYFLFTTRGPEQFYFPLNKSFARAISEDLSVIAGTGLIMYPFRPKEWQNFIYNLNLIQELSSIKIYPFGFLSQNESWAMSVPLTKTATDTTQNVVVIFGNDRWVAGRVYLKVVNAVSGEDPLFAFDIYIRPTFAFAKSALFRIFIALVILYLLLNIFVIGRLGKFGTDIHTLIVQRFDMLKRGIRQIASGNLDYKFKISGEDEFVELAGHFNEMGEKLKKTIAEARDRDRLDHELKIARQVQQSLLPTDLPVVPGYQIAASLTTANEIGGDFYDILPLDKNRYLFTIGDVSGKGSSAAFYMAQFISLLRFSPQFTDDPAEIAKRLNDYFANQIMDRQIFITAIIGILDYKHNFVKFIRAGHTPPILVPVDRAEEIREIESDGLGIGLTRTVSTFKKSLQKKTVRLASGELVVFYTDGIVEAARANDKGGKAMQIFGEDTFRSILRSLKEKSANDVLKSVQRELTSFYHGAAPVDDYTLFVIRRNPED